MSSPDYKRRRKETKSKYRKLWKNRSEFLNGLNNKSDGESSSNQFHLNDSKDFPSLNENTNVKKVHVPKTKYALAFGFLGTTYHGYQKQVEYKTGDMDKVRTIEGTLENCLFQIGAIDEAFRNTLHKLQMSKSSRTDKGVHAACTYIGGRFNINLNHVEELDIDQPDNDQMPDPSNTDLNLESNGAHEECVNTDDIAIDEQPAAGSSNLEYNEGEQSSTDPSKEELFVKALNSALPPDIRCYKIQRVTKGFDARLMCSKRQYEFLFPEWLLCNSFELPNEEHTLVFEQLEDYMRVNLENHDRVRAFKSQESLYESKGNFVLIDPDLERFTKLIKQYEGTHDFHNFTVRQKLESNNTKRYIENVTVKLETIEDMRVVKILILGQSFLYNQIRKMICLALQEYLNVAPKNTIKYALKRGRLLNVNTVPSEGLLLHHPKFDAYNITRCNMANLPYIKFEDIESEVESFKKQYIYPEIKRSIECKIWEGWLETNNIYPFYLENHLIPNGEASV